MIAVLIPVYNSADTVAKALDSVLSQTYLEDKMFRIFLVDNGSTDNLREVVNNYPIYYLTCSERGVAPALNTGLFEAMRYNPKYIARIDADDIWLPNKLEIQIKHMEAEGLDVCGTQMLMYREGKFLRETGYPINHGLIVNYLQGGMNPIAHPSVVVRSQVFTYVGGYNEVWKGAEDFDLWCRAAIRFKLGNTSESLVKYNLEDKDRSVGDFNAAFCGKQFGDLHGLRCPHS